MSEEIKENVAQMDDDEKYLPKNPWISAIPTLLAVFIYVIDGTIANVALPHMAGSFSATRDESMWILTSYLIASGIIIPSVDFFSKFFGRKNFYIISIMMFTIASMLCGMARNLGEMVIFRVLQGAGGGGIVPISQALMMESFPKEKRGTAMAVFGMGVIIAPIVGPVLGGWITDNWSWPWIFFINVPFGCLAAILSKKMLFNPPYSQRQKGVKMDGLGFLFLTIWLLCLQVFFDKGNNADWFNTTWIRWIFGASCFSGICFFISQIVRKNTLVDLSVFKDRNFIIGTFIQVIMQAVLYASLAILPQFLQSMMGYTAFLSGFSMMPRGLGSMTAMVICALIADKVDKRMLVCVGLAFLGTAGLVFGFLNLQIASMNIMIPNYIMGLGMGLSMVPIINLSMETISNQQMTNASGLQNLLKNIGSAVGTSLVATMLTRFAQMHQYMMVGHLNELNPTFVERLQTYTASFLGNTDLATATYSAKTLLYNQLLQQSTLWAYIDTFRLFAIASFLIAPLVLLMKRKNLT
ncbi:TPA: EmrB/QacA family drug resistance transporter [Candidatus Gastranaerophilales bacterium HUM_12]|nr:MAG TPA: EmrB/QacA family drug resistance transporter [Candidatus Gastranaerophilales bacterium HUM_12]